MKANELRVPLPKCRCDEYLASKGFHENSCKYAIAFNKALEKFGKKLAYGQKNMPTEFNEIINRKFWELF